MSLAEFNKLTELGSMWCGNVWMKNDSNAAGTQILGQVNEQLQSFRPNTFRVYTVFQKYDPYVRTAGLKSGTYAAIVGWAAGQPDGGKSAAGRVIDWFYDGLLKDLPLPMAALVTIVSFAEVGRGYGKMEVERFALWIQSIQQAHNAESAKALWLSVNQSYPPSLTYRADQTDWDGDVEMS